jgi:hypothetical protein
LETLGVSDLTIYLLASAARLRGFEEDLGTTGNQFNTLTSILYVGYLLMQAPSYAPIPNHSEAHLLFSKQHALTTHGKDIVVPLKLHDTMGCYHYVHEYATDFA